MQKFLNTILKFLLDTTGWYYDANGNKVGAGNDPTQANFWPQNYERLANLFKILNPILYAVMAVVGAAGAIYAIILGVNLAKAEDTSKRDDAKKHLITVLIAVAVTIALVLFFTTLMPMIIQAFM